MLALFDLDPMQAISSDVFVTANISGWKPVVHNAVVHHKRMNADSGGCVNKMHIFSACPKYHSLFHGLSKFQLIE
jgi:hypothetical protein